MIGKACIAHAADSSSELKPRASEWQHLGTLGPIIHAEVCDTIKVVFKNNSEKLDYSVHPHGVFYEKDSEGAEYMMERLQMTKLME